MVSIFCKITDKLVKMRLKVFMQQLSVLFLEQTFEKNSTIYRSDLNFYNSWVVILLAWQNSKKIPQSCLPAIYSLIQKILIICSLIRKSPVLAANRTFLTFSMTEFTVLVDSAVTMSKQSRIASFAMSEIMFVMSFLAMNWSWVIFCRILCRSSQPIFLPISLLRGALNEQTCYPPINPQKNLTCPSVNIPLVPTTFLSSLSTSPSSESGSLLFTTSITLLFTVSRQPKAYYSFRIRDGSRCARHSVRQLYQMIRTSLVRSQSESRRWQQKEFASQAQRLLLSLKPGQSQIVMSEHTTFTGTLVSEYFSCPILIPFEHAPLTVRHAFNPISSTVMAYPVRQARRVLFPTPVSPIKSTAYFSVADMEMWVMPQRILAWRMGMFIGGCSRVCIDVYIEQKLVIMVIFNCFPIIDDMYSIFILVFCSVWQFQGFNLVAKSFVFRQQDANVYDPQFVAHVFPNSSLICIHPQAPARLQSALP